MNWYSGTKTKAVHTHHILPRLPCCEFDAVYLELVEARSVGGRSGHRKQWTTQPLEGQPTVVLNSIYQGCRQPVILEWKRTAQLLNHACQCAWKFCVINLLVSCNQQIKLRIKINFLLNPSLRSCTSCLGPHGPHCHRNRNQCGKQNCANDSTQSHNDLLIVFKGQIHPQSKKRCMRRPQDRVERL